MPNLVPRPKLYSWDSPARTTHFYEWVLGMESGNGFEELGSVRDCVYTSHFLRFCSEAGSSPSRPCCGIQVGRQQKALCCLLKPLLFSLSYGYLRQLCWHVQSESSLTLCANLSVYNLSHVWLGVYMVSVISLHHV